MKNQKGFALIVPLLVLIVIAGVGATAYYIYAKNNESSDVYVEENTEDPAEESDLSDSDDIYDLEDQSVPDEEGAEQ